MEYLKANISAVPRHVWILGFIVLAGVFLRTYRFHDWLLFEYDQVRDTAAIEQVVSGEKPWPLLGPTMRASGDTQEALFRVGPIYYYFQVFSAKIFGMKAESMAYPDVFFGILAIPLFYFFLRKYFRTDASLYLTLLYAVSFFAIRYSRFAWNPNPIPFFSILFLLSMHEFLTSGEKTSKRWVGIAGAAIGIGIQLHAIVLLLFGLTSAVTAFYLLKKNRSVWKKILVVLAVATTFNIPQMASEWQTGFANSKSLLSSPVKEGDSGKRSVFSIFADDLSCTVESNGYILSSLGREDCGFAYVKSLEDSRAGRAFRETVFWPEFAAVLLFSVFGYALLAYRFRTERNEAKKNFLGLNMAFLGIFFLVTLPVIGANFKEFRYFNAVFLAPYLLLGLIMQFLVEKRPLVFRAGAALLGIFLIATNVSSLYRMSVRLADRKGNDGHAVYLGETEAMIRYIGETGGASGDAYLMSDKIYSGNISLQMTYLAKRDGFTLIKVPGPDNVPGGAALFYVAQNRENGFGTEVEGLAVAGAKDFGEMRIYRLER